MTVVRDCLLVCLVVVICLCVGETTGQDDHLWQPDLQFNHIGNLIRRSDEFRSKFRQMEQGPGRGIRDMIMDKRRNKTHGADGKGPSQNNGAMEFSADQATEIKKTIRGKARGMKRNKDGSMSVSVGQDKVRTAVFKVREYDENMNPVCGKPQRNFDPKMRPDDESDESQKVRMSGKDKGDDDAGEKRFPNKIRKKIAAKIAKFEGKSTVVQLDDVLIEFECSLSVGNDSVEYEFPSTETMVINPGDVKCTLNIVEYVFCGPDRNCTCDDGTETVGKFLSVRMRLQPETGSGMGDVPKNKPGRNNNRTKLLEGTVLETRLVSDLVLVCDGDDASPRDASAVINTFSDDDAENNRIVGLEMKIEHNDECSNYSYVWDPAIGESTDTSDTTGESAGDATTSAAGEGGTTSAAGDSAGTTTAASGGDSGTTSLRSSSRSFLLTLVLAALLSAEPTHPHRSRTVLF